MTRVVADVGQTGLRVAWEGGRSSVPVGAVHMATPGAVDRLTASVVGACAAADCARPELLLLGISGWHDRATAQVLVDGLREALGGATVMAARDDVTAYLGALGTRPGVVLLAGTGVVALGSNGDATRRVGGLGWAVDDEGGGFWVGRQGLLHAARADDGRGPTTTLLPRAVATFGAVEEWPGRIHEGGAAVTTVASFARAVAQAADDGDAVALDIWDRAAQHLADVVRAASAVFPQHGPPAIALTGGLGAAGDVLLGPLDRRLASLGLQRCHVAHGRPLDGAGLVDTARSLSLFADYIVTTE